MTARNEDFARARWFVVWRYSAPDPMVWVALAAFAFLTVMSVLDGWAFGAALGGVGIGSLAVWWAFISDHFRMKGASNGR